MTTHFAGAFFGAFWSGFMPKVIGLGALLVGVVLCGAARAEAVPEGIVAWLKTTNARLVMLHERVLYVSYRVPVVDEAFFREQVEGLCSAPGKDARYSWGGAVVEEIRVMNEGMTQGQTGKGCG